MVRHWKGHWDLHLWMDNLYEAKGGEASPAESFNDTTVELTVLDIDALERAVRAGSLPLGESSLEHGEEGLAFITAARTVLAEGKVLYYCGNW